MLSSRKRFAGFAVACTVAVLAGCGFEGSEPDPTVVSVPGDASTISQGLAEVAAGGLVLVSPGRYDEEVIVTKPGVTIRGTDRNAVVVDAQVERPYGIAVLANGVRVENLTVQNATLYGLLFTSVQTDGVPAGGSGSGYSGPSTMEFPPLQRFRVDHVTAINNGLYGIYAFNSQHGVITNSLASGSADSGFYLGQCRDCDVAVTANIASHNAVGFENANASDSVVIAGNRFVDNRVGLTLTSDFQEAFTPQGENLVVGNLIADNNSSDSPEHAEGGFGIGVGIAGGTNNSITGNRITGNQRGGLLLDNTAELPASGNAFMGNAFADNGVDVANISGVTAPAVGNCPDQPESSTLTTLPADLFAGCAASGTVAANPTIGAAELPAQTAPPGVAFSDVTPPPAQPSMVLDTTVPEPLPGTVALPSAADFPIPGADLLADLVANW